MKKNAYEFFTPSEIKPGGWLKQQLQIQAQGLSGNLDKVWPDIRDSAWIGGNREGWERVPYWLDGFIPLAWLLDDADLKARAAKYMDAIMDAQNEDGWICPCKPEQRDTYDTWAALLMSKVLMVYAVSAGSERAEKALYRMMKQFFTFLDCHTLRDWGATRWFEGVVPALWLYDRRHEEWILDYCNKLCYGGTDWKKIMKSGIWENQKTGWNYYSHVVNLGMMLKSDALMSRINGGDPNVFARSALNHLLKNHGMAVHHFSGDECLHGSSPLAGSELCGVVEAMYSYETLFSVSGNPEWLDCLDNLAFNALPATVSPDMWTHQYDQMSNQVCCTRITGQSIFRTNGTYSHVFGLEPNYGCCTANFNQGFPKYAWSTFLKAPDGIVCGALAPAAVSTEICQTPVTVELQTNYPFGQSLTYTVTTEKPIEFALYLRIPGTAASATVDGKSVLPGTLVPLRKTWTGKTEIRIELTFETRMEARKHGLYTVWRGPLLYALPIGEKKTPVEYVSGGVERKFPYCDYNIEPTSAWNYGFAGDAAQMVPGSQPIDKQFVFTPDHPPVWLDVPMCPISWDYHDGYCAALPKSNRPIGPVHTMRLIPYGCTNLRITETFKAKIK